MFTYYLIIVPIVAVVLIGLNWLISTSNSYIEKDSPFECGFTSFQQSRSAFSVAFILVAILFLPFDLEISSILPYVVSAYNNNIYGLIILTIFLITLVCAFILEIAEGALKINREYIKEDKELYIENIQEYRMHDWVV
uniref:NADH-ubiquinone oxidoreductase chain 3 n=1 Tax=Candida blackwelliae TaxID=497110 RepID=S5U634_9ASCO|nr:NADH dehydrogenase subunit 3 [Candida blackwelliae]AGS44551.1 NADH dehydrogenase subunit 3 [Candida blackwelliae]